MRKGIADARSGTIPFDAEVLQELKDKGFKFVQVKGLTPDNHYDYSEPHLMLLVPLKELPDSETNRDIYEPLESRILDKWASEKSDRLPVLIAASFFK